ncbi:MAG: TetR/AcrR family transcriptional regulator [Lachnospiraceae bacterium]|nr:TetR/AcrR family transcriptional regulator [Lachnospiraceae bacterium]
MAKRMNNTEERKKQILDIAEELFLKHGYYGVNLDDVAAGASVVRGTVLHYFDSKENLYKCVLDRRAQKSADLLVALMVNKDQPVLEILRTFVYFCMRQFKEDKDDTDRCFGDENMRYQLDCVRIGTYYKLLDPFEALLERGNEEGVLRIVNTRARASSVLFAVFGLTGESISTIEVTAELYDLIGNMLGVDLKSV